METKIGKYVHFSMRAFLFPSFQILTDELCQVGLLNQNDPSSYNAFSSALLFLRETHKMIGKVTELKALSLLSLWQTISSVVDTQKEALDFSRLSVALRLDLGK